MPETPVPETLPETVPKAAPTADNGPNPGGSWRDVWRATTARRRALRAEMRKFTARQRRRRRVWIVSISAVLLLVVASAAIAYSPLFAVRHISIAGQQDVDAAAIQDALSDQLGTPLGLVDHDAVAEDLSQFHRIEAFSLESRPPSELVVRIVERRPIGAIRAGGRYTTVDAAGVELASAGDDPGLALIEVPGGTSSDSFTAVAEVLRALPDDIRQQVAIATASSAEDVRLRLRDSNAEVVWGSRDDTTAKADTLRSALTALPPNDTSFYDVSAPGTLVTR